MNLFVFFVHELLHQHTAEHHNSQRTERALALKRICLTVASQKQPSKPSSQDSTSTRSPISSRSRRASVVVVAAGAGGAAASAIAAGNRGRPRAFTEAVLDKGGRASCPWPQAAKAAAAGAAGR